MYMEVGGGGGGGIFPSVLPSPTPKLDETMQVVEYITILGISLTYLRESGLRKWFNLKPLHLTTGTTLASFWLSLRDYN